MTDPISSIGVEFENDHRRGFMTHVLAGTIGLLVGAVPMLAGLAFFLDPLMRKRSGGASDGFLRIPLTLEALAVDGEPQLVKISMDRVDAWNTYRNQPVGAVFVRRTGDKEVVAFNQRCPHLGCAVDYKPADKQYSCPCHTSAFGTDGQRKNLIPPRGLDALDVEIRNDHEIWIKFQNFRATTPEKIPVA